MNDFQKPYPKKNRLINIPCKHCFDVTLADFEQIIKWFHAIGSRTIE